LQAASASSAATAVMGRGVFMVRSDFAHAANAVKP
jgi:hypothetical protein